MEQKAVECGGVIDAKGKHKGSFGGDGASAP
jgi:hypothetical protein